MSTAVVRRTPDGRAASAVRSTLDWFIWKRSQKRLQEVWVDGVIGEERGYLAYFHPGGGSSMNFETREILIDPMLWQQHLAPYQSLPLAWGPYTLVRPAQASIFVARALAEHEVAHVEYTQPCAVSSQAVQWIVNALEDERIERVLAAHWPQAALDFAIFGKLLWQVPLQRNHYDNAAASVLSAILYHRWDAEFGGTSPVLTPFCTIFADPYLGPVWDTWLRVRPLVEQAWVAPDTAAAAALAEEIGRILWPPKIDPILRSAQQERTMYIVKDMTPLADGVEGMRVGGDDARGAGEAPAHVPEPHPEEYVKAEHVDAKEESGDGSGGVGRVPDDDLEAVPDSAIDPSERKITGQPYVLRERKLMGQIRRVTQQLTAPAPYIDPVANDRSGRFSVRALARSAGTKPVVRKEQVGLDPTGVCVLILIDGSGSMQDALNTGTTMDRTVDVALVIERACAAAAIPLMGGIAGGEARLRQGTVTVPALEGIVDPLTKKLSSTVSKRIHWWKKWESVPGSEVPRALLCGLEGNGADESVSPSLREASEIIMQRPEGTKLVLSMHDGNPTDESRDQVRRTVTALRKHYRGAITYTAVALASNASGAAFLRTSLTEMFGDGPDQVIAIDDISELAPRLGRLLERLRKQG